MAIGNTFTKIIQKSSLPRYIRNISSIGIDYGIIAKSNSKIYDDNVDFLYGVNGYNEDDEVGNACSFAPSVDCHFYWDS